MYSTYGEEIDHNSAKWSHWTVNELASSLHDEKEELSISTRCRGLLDFFRPQLVNLRVDLEWRSMPRLESPAIV